MRTTLLLDVDGNTLIDFASGIASVSGSYDAAGSQRITDQDPDVPVDVGAAAFFDVDNTLVQGSSLVEFGFGLARRRYIRISEILPVAWKQLKFRLSGAENAKDVAAGRASVPLQAIRRVGRANVLVVIDEGDKAATGDHNGSLVSTLLPYLESTSARRLYDVYLECEVDLSPVSYVITANELARVAGQPLRAVALHQDLLQRLAQHLQRTAVPLGQFVQEQHAMMREADLARLRAAPAARDSDSLCESSGVGAISWLSVSK